MPPPPPHVPRGHGLGFTGLALGAMMERDALASSSGWAPPNGQPHFVPKAKSVIWLFMNRGVCHMKSFNPKPMLSKYGGKTIAETPFACVQDSKKLALERSIAMHAEQRKSLYPLQIDFKKHGQSGIEVGDWFPHVALNVDRLAIVRSMWTTDSNHGAQTPFHSGRNMLDGEFPTLGGWVHYGQGSLNENLPQFLSIGTREYWNKKDGFYLGPAQDAVPLRIDPNNPLDFGRPERPVSPQSQAVGLDLVREWNALRSVESPRDPVLAARVASYELAFRMQRFVPEVLDFSRETAETKALYGLELPHCRDFGTQLLAARRFVEKGVRFIQIQHGGGDAGSWDAHSGLKTNHSQRALRGEQVLIRVEGSPNLLSLQSVPAELLRNYLADCYGSEEIAQEEYLAGFAPRGTGT